MRTKILSKTLRLLVLSTALLVGLTAMAAEPKKNKKADFNHKISLWGNKGNRVLRNDFSEIQKYMFMACIAKSDVDFIALEKGKIEVSKVALQLIETMESYTNGGLEMISLKLETQRTLFDQPTGFFDLIYTKGN